MRVNVRVTCRSDVRAVKAIADANRRTIGFIMRPIFEASVRDKELIVAELGGNVVGFIRFHTRRDGWHTVYELCVADAFRGRGIGRLLLAEIPSPVRLKCPVDNDSNAFYRHIGLRFEGREPGKRRELNLYVRCT